MDHGWVKQPIAKPRKAKPQARKDREAELKDHVAEEHVRLKRDFERRNPKWIQTGTR